MSEKLKKYILGSLRSYTGDNLERANYAWGSLPDSELDKEHGQSGETKREIWDSYKAERSLNKEAIDFIGQL